VGALTCGRFVSRIFVLRGGRLDALSRAGIDSVFRALWFVSRRWTLPAYVTPAHVPPLTFSSTTTCCVLFSLIVTDGGGGGAANRLQRSGPAALVFSAFSQTFHNVRVFMLFSSPAVSASVSSDLAQHIRRFISRCLYAVWSFNVASFSGCSFFAVSLVILEQYSSLVRTVSVFWFGR
jgi:hypothetical protein